MVLIDLYIQEVTRRLPEKSRKDIALELRSTIEDMLPEEYTEQDVKTTLAKMGNPATLASGYRDRPQHLIGPRYFEMYKTILKMGLPISMIITFIGFVASQVAEFNGEEAILNVVITILSEGLATALYTGLQVFFWATLSFALVERIDPSKDQEPLMFNMKKWTPDDLKDTPYMPKERMISKIEVYGGLFWTVIWATVYFYADHLVGVYQSGSEGLVFVTPIFNQQVLQSFWPYVVIIIVLEVLLALYKLVVAKWTMKMSLFNLILQVICIVMFVVLINNVNLFHPDFITFTAENVFTDLWESWLKFLAIVLFMMGAAYNAYDGFRRVK
ncbi:hypothetical protein IEO70_12880 [Bacillus sp. AGMB 02131]|uniref:Uncharacterized protein n=1 Tax=Peribacillus faecalis TaxID=2772559 RepID=A0A927CY88_9BACI|nr:hypothetical protein [Peribacillus faecalis]MBD3109241.1 hypothetical protein [Peribacillus faecalis]